MIKLKLFEDFEIERIKDDFLFLLNLEELEIKFDFTSQFDSIIFYFDGNDYIGEYNKIGEYFSISYSILPDNEFDWNILYDDIRKLFKLYDITEIYPEPNIIRRTKEKIFNE